MNESRRRLHAKSWVGAESSWFALHFACAAPSGVALANGITDLAYNTNQQTRGITRDTAQVLGRAHVPGGKER